MPDSGNSPRPESVKKAKRALLRAQADALRTKSSQKPPTKSVVIPFKLSLDVNHAIPGDKAADIWLALHQKQMNSLEVDASDVLSEDEKALYTILTKFITADYLILDVRVSQAGEEEAKREGGR